MKFSKLFSILLALIFILAMLPTAFAAEAVSSVTFVTTPEDAAVTLNGVTKQASGGTVTFEVADGTYECQVSATGYVWQEGTVTVSGNAAYSVTLAEDTAKSYWTFDTDAEGWTCGNTVDTLSHVDGALKLQMTSNDPIIVKTGVNLDMTGRDRAVLTYKKENASESSFLLYFKSIVNGTTYGNSGARALTKTLPATTDGFVTTVFEAHEYFAGTLVDLRVDPIPTAANLTGATFYMDKLEIPKIAQLELAVSSATLVTFNVSPEDAAVTLNGVTKQASGGVASFSVSDGTYDCQVSATGYVWQEGTVTVSGSAAYSVILTEDSEKSYWTFDSDVEGWSNRNTTADTLSHSDGALKLEMTSNDPGVTKNGVNLDMTARDRVVITYKKENAGESELLLYFKSIVDGATYDLAEARALKKTLPATTEGFVTTVLEANEYFAGTLENLRLDPVTTAQNQTGAVFYLDKLEIPKVESLSIISENECYLEFSVSPATADVSLFGEDAALVGEKRAVDGKAGFIVSKGNYTYTVEKFGYEVFEGSVTAGQDTTVDVSLTPLSEYYSYDFSQKASVAQIMEDGWNISSPETLVIDESYGIQTGVAGVENVFSYMLEEAIDHGTIELSLEVMGSVPVEGGYFDASLRPTPDSTIFCFYVTNADGDVFQYKTPNNATQALSGKYDFTGELHTLDFVIDLDTGSLKIRHDDTVILEYADYGNKTGGNTFAGLYMHFKPDC